ncbi:MAG: RNase P subunit p30 family protein [archaeon]
MRKFPADLVQFADLKEISLRAQELGIPAIIIAQNFASAEKISELRKKGEGLETEFKFCHVLQGTDANEFNKFGGKVDLLCVRGGSVPANKFGVTHRDSAFLLEPCTFGQNAFDASTARTAVENKKPVAFTFSQFLEARPLQQAFLFQNALLALKLVRHYRAEALFFSGARTVSEMRSSKNLCAFAQLLGFDELQARKACVESPKEIFGR